MSFPLSQIVSVSYPLVVADKRKPQNQWAESTLFTWMEKKGFIKKENFGPTIEASIDYRRNPTMGFLSTDLQQMGATKTEVISSASYTPAQLGGAIIWTKFDEMTNSSDRAKVMLVKSLIANALDSHDDVIEQYLFASSTNGFLGLQTHIPTTGLGSDGGIDAAIESVWRPQQATYADDTDIEAAFTTVWNSCSKGSGSALQPQLMVSDSTTNGIFEGTQQALQRYDSQDIKAGAKSLMFKTANYIFSQYGDTKVYFLNNVAFQLQFSKDYFRQLDEVEPLQGEQGFQRKVYSGTQTIVTNRSRLGVAHT